MSKPTNPGQRACPACGAIYGQPGTRCYPGVSHLVAAQSGDGDTGVSGYCANGHGKLGVPGPRRDEVERAVKQIRAAGASWDIVARTLARFGLKIPPYMMPGPRPTTRGQWPPGPPEPTESGPRPPWRDPRPPLPPGVQNPAEAPGRKYRGEPPRSTGDSSAQGRPDRKSSGEPPYSTEDSSVRGRPTRRSSGSGGGGGGGTPPSSDDRSVRPYVDGPEESKDPRECLGGVMGHGSADVDGRCPWCKKQLTRRLSPPRWTGRTEMGEEYRRHYDPDHGSDPHDT